MSARKRNPQNSSIKNVLNGYKNSLGVNK